MIRPTTPPCPLAIATETLSALRDNSLVEAESQALRQHIPTCAACQARLAGFDRVAQVLRRQRDLEPNGRIWAAMQPRITGKESHPMATTRRSLVSGGIAALSVILVVALFAIVLQGRHTGGPATATMTQPPQSTSSAAPTKPVPTSTGVAATPPPVNQLPSPAQAWGAGGTGTTVNVGKLMVKGITPDGQHILGYQLATDGQNYDIGWLTVATGIFTTFDQSAVNGAVKRNNPPNCCVSDGRFIIGANGTSEGSSTNAPWYYDTQTGQQHSINSIEFSAFGIHDGVVYHRGRTSGLDPGTLYGLNLLTGADTPVSGTGTIFNLVNFVWPIFIYTETGSNGATNLLAHNLATGGDIILSRTGDYGSNTSPSAVTDGDGIIFITVDASGTLLRDVQHLLTSASTLVTLTALPTGVNRLAGANARVVLIPEGNTGCTTSPLCGYSVAWDRTLQKFVLLSQSDNTDVWLNGDYFALLDHKTNLLTVYDTTKFAMP